IKLRRRALDPGGQVGAGDDHWGIAGNKALGLVEVRRGGDKLVLVEADVEIGCGSELRGIECHFAVLQHLAAGLPREFDREGAVPLRAVLPLLPLSSLAALAAAAME